MVRFQHRIIQNHLQTYRSYSCYKNQKTHTKNPKPAPRPKKQIPYLWLRSKSLNETKTELIIFRSPRKNLSREPGIRIKNYKLKLYSHVKYLNTYR